MVLEVGSKNYADDLLSIKKVLSHMESLVNGYNGYVLGEPTAKFGWTFFKIAFKPNLQNGIEERFSDMLDRYRQSDKSEKFAEFMADYLNSRCCDVKIKRID